MSRLSFEFKALEKARLEIGRVHLSEEEMCGEPAQDLVGRLLRQIEGMSVAEMPALAETLRRPARYASVFVYSVTSKEDVRAKVRALLLAVPRKEHVPAGWQVAVHHGRHKGFLDLMRSVVHQSVEAFPRLQEGSIGRITRRLRSEDLFGEILAEIESGNLSIEDWHQNEAELGVAIPQESALGSGIRWKLLSEGSGEAIRRNEPAKVRLWTKELRHQEYAEFAAHYLTVVEVEHWHRGIVDDIDAKYGLPASGHPFWGTVPEHVRLSFQRLVAGRKLRSFFDGVYDPKGRFAFWQQYIDRITDLAFPRSKERLFMAFGSFGVVEFRDVGNAAYFYLAEEFKWIRGSIGNGNADLKDRSRTLYRLLHQEGWQQKMTRRMTRMLAGQFSAERPGGEKR